MTLSSRLAGLVAAAALLVPLAAGAQPILPFPPPPSVLFHAPPTLVDIAPGVQVVPNHEHEVFFYSGRYYLRADGHWYRSRGLRWRWKHMEPASVPSVLRQLANGHYRRWNPDRDPLGDRPGHLREADGPRVFFDAPPRLIMSEEGFQVVPDSEHEVFFVEGRYYLRHEGRWYRSRGKQWRWRLLDFDLVPRVLTNMKHPQGHYRHYRHGRPDTDRHDRDRNDRDRNDRDRNDRNRNDRDRPDGDRTDRDHGNRPGQLHEADRPPEPRLKNADDRKDNRKDRRDDRKDNRKDRREDRKDDRKDKRDDRKDKHDD